MIRYILLTLVLLVASANAQPPTGGGGTTDPTQFWPLHVFKAGTGLGTISGAGPLNCGTQCTASYVQGVTTIIYATPVVGSTFTGWSGACSGVDPCSVTMISVKNVTATFTLNTVSGADIFAGPPPAPGGSLGTCLTQATACDVWRALDVVQCGQILQLNNGVYTGTRYMLNFVGAGLAGKSCTAGNEIVVRAETDGGVFIDGQFTNTPWWMGGAGFGGVQAFWVFEGFDIGNAGPLDYVFSGAPRNSIFRRICLSNTRLITEQIHNNVHVWGTGGIGNTWEDICAFGVGRNTFITGAEPTDGNNIYRRIWVRFEGSPSPLEDGLTAQLNYVTGGAPGGNRHENIISVYRPEQNIFQFGGTPHPGMVMRERTFATDFINGWIAYGNDGFTGPNHAANGLWYADRWGTGAGGIRQHSDIFVDSRSQPNSSPGDFQCILDGWVACTSSTNRLTVIRTPSQPDIIFTNWASSNINQGTNLATLPNFYTGAAQGGSGVGARNCFEYQNSVLTSTALWPWRMDDRIKAALARANAAGTGGTALDGVAGSGGTSSWAANTVTSEIVSRYGAPPPECVR